MSAPAPATTPSGAGAQQSLAPGRQSLVRRYLGLSRRRPPVRARVDRGFLRGLDAEQALAVELGVAPGPGALVVTGEAGSGKTLVLSRIAQVLEAQGRRLVVTAVTHQALHVVRSRLAGTKAGTVTLAHVMRNGRALATADVVVIEEASMVCGQHLYGVLGGLGLRTRLVLVGDPAQLPPISPGTPFRDAIAAGVPTVRLQGQYRQGADSGVREFVAAVREGSVPQRLPAGVSLHCGIADPVDQLVDVVRSARTRESLPFVVTWLRDDWLAANLALQAALNPNGERVGAVAMRDTGGSIQLLELRVGDRVTCSVNVPEVGLYNGLKGEVVGRAERLVRFRTDAGDTIDLPDSSLELGYCATVHRAQGGEWEHVVVYQPGVVRSVAVEWYYTALSRARSRLDLVTALDRKELEENMLGRGPN